MKHEFRNGDSVPIDPGGPNQIQSQIEVQGLHPTIRDVRVTMDIEHTYTNDLRITLVSPQGTEVMLVEREGGSGNNFRETSFDDAAVRSIVGGDAPFFGTFRPESSLAVLDGDDPNGTWTLRVEDMATRDGGELRFWVLSIDDGHLEFTNLDPQLIRAATPNTVTSTIDVTGLGGSMIADVFVSVDIEHTWVEDLRLTLRGPDDTEVILIDREGGEGDDLRQTQFDDAAETSITDGQAPFVGRFRPEQALAGFRDKLVERSGSQDPVFIGPRSVSEYATLRGSNEELPVPIANTGGSGTREAHWREITFGNELMTGFVGAAGNPVSRLTVACLEDMGYTVDYSTADAFDLPIGNALVALMSTSRGCCRTTSHKPIAVDPDPA